MTQINGYAEYLKQHYSIQQQQEDMSIISEVMKTNFIEKPKDAITCSVMEDLKRRADLGLKKYNTALQENNHQNMLQHGYEEALDMAQYLKKEITTLNTVQDLVKQFSDDRELGEIIRSIYGQTETNRG